MKPMTRVIEEVGLMELARRCGVTYQAIRKWERHRVPAERCRQVERESNGLVTVHDLRPDVFGPAPDQHEAA